MERAKGDNTYCRSNECVKRETCIRHCTHYEFDVDRDYWFMEKCEKFEMEDMQ